MNALCGTDGHNLRAVFKTVYAGFGKVINDFTIGQSRIHTLEKFRSR